MQLATPQGTPTPDEATEDLGVKDTGVSLLHHQVLPGFRQWAASERLGCEARLPRLPERALGVWAASAGHCENEAPCPVS